MKPTLQIYGTGNGLTQDGQARHNSELLDRVSEKFAFKWRSENAFSPVFSFTGEAANADGFLFQPNCDLFSLIAAITEKEVDNPFLQHQHDTTRSLPNNRKPLVLLGLKEDWSFLTDMIEHLNKCGTIRGDLLGKTVHFSPTLDKAFDHFKETIPTDAGNKRLRNVDHKEYIDFPDAMSDHILISSKTPKIKSAPTIAFFGSAGTKNEEYIRVAKEAGRLCSENGWNIIHGGGIAGIMQALTEGGAEHGVHVHGITADNRYAMFLAGEKDPSQVIPQGQARFTAGKDMIHRIELYAKNSEALVALPGGIGTLEEILLTAKLLEEKHPAVIYEDKNGQDVKKPMILVNQNGIWDGLLSYYKNRPELKKIFDENITIVGTVEEMNRHLLAHFAKHPPKHFAADRIDDTIRAHKRHRVLRPDFIQQALFPDETEKSFSRSK